AGNAVSAPVLFNLARVSLALGDREAATRYVNRYLQKDQRSNWSREAQEIARVAGGGAPGARPSTPAASQPAATTAQIPGLWSAVLGASRSRLVGALGEPNGGQDAAGTVWRYPARGLTVVLDEEGYAKMFVVESRAGGALGGVTVGDAWDA